MGMSFIMNKIQPSQLAEEQRNATKLFRQLYSQIQTTLALYDPTELDVKDAMDKIGMVVEMYRNCAGFFSLVEESIESSLEETDIDRREDGEMLELKVALQLGRSMSELRDLAQKSTYSRIEGTTIDEFASKLF
ncbi:hypothetical protein GH714_021554 [Hevea brasiliensis]|uniref:Uncharacterized protein n=1 Tax=Hevea brasiliensis TaxID=3981 RepID=A0A6A6LVT1_HEVBR|nr:hypothetical protein GH714_021554 [Hevea brasiliensis]